jgi:DNA-binding MarR family transcriptional regulator
MHEKSIESYVDQISHILPKVLRWFHVSRADALTKVQLNPAQFFVLEFIEHNGPQNMSELARNLSVSLPAMTKTVDKLHADKMVERVHIREDRRVIKINITTKGKKIVHGFKKQRKQAMFEIVAQLSQKDREDYLRIITKIYEIALLEQGKKS